METYVILAVAASVCAVWNGATSVRICGELRRRKWIVSINLAWVLAVTSILIKLRVL
jgi:hypothetical protein